MATTPLLLQTSYAEIVQQLHAGEDKTGSLYSRMLRGASYTYIKRSVANTRVDEFIGPTQNPDVAKRIARIRDANRLARERRTVIAALRSYGFATPSRKLGLVLETLGNAGLLRKSVLVGTAAYQCYSAFLGKVLSSTHLMTLDADLATAELALTADGEEQSMEGILKRADSTFSGIPALTRGAPSSSFKSSDGFVVDLLTPAYRRNDKNPMPLKKLAAGAIPLQHLRWLITNPVQAAVLYKSGIAVHIPQPARYAVHKLIIAQKRLEHSVKRLKDLQQARELIEILQTTSPWELLDAYEDACAQGRSGWREPIHRSLKEIGVSPKELGAS